jgi:hypothetical protein
MQTVGGAALTKTSALVGNRRRNSCFQARQHLAAIEIWGYHVIIAAFSLFAQSLEPVKTVTLQATPMDAATAVATGSGPVLWRGIRAEMPVAALRAMYPQASNVSYRDDRTVLTDVPIMEGCEAKVNILHPQGVVKEIVMRGEGAIAGRCSLKLITALSGKYGEPAEKDKVGGSLFAREGKNYVWLKDGIALQFKRYTSGALGGGGLFAASWELRYSANAMNVDL